jgi:tetratricopeptide (TPR) repeat protein
MQPHPHAHSLTPKPKKQQLQLIDREFETDIEGFIEAVLDEEKQDYQPTLESFQVHANKIRQEIGDAMHAFQRNYHSGYEAICEALDAEGVQRPQVSPENLAIFDDSLAFMEALDEGKAIYQLLGFTPEIMKKFYEIAVSLAEKNKYEKARDAFYFLVTIASDIAIFWLGLGLCNAKMLHFSAAADDFRRSLELDPQSSDAYLGAIHALLQDGKQDEADAICDQGLDFALKNRPEPLAESLGSILEEAKLFIQKSK